MAQTGETAPPFQIETDDPQRPRVSLADFSGRKLVLFFYPRDNTPGCTKEAVAFSNLKQAFADAGAEVMGISADTVKKHANFRKKHGLTVLLGADPEHEVLKAYGVWQKKKLYGREYMGTVRTTFLIDGDGIIRRVWEKVKVDGHAGEVLQAVREI